MFSRAPRRKPRQRVAPPRQIETLEGRVVMSADPFLGGLAAPPLTQHGLGPSLGHAIVESAPAHDPNADFWLYGDVAFDVEEDFGQRIEQTLADAHDLTGQDHVVANYGFDGSGQTVAVIDSGIAYSHYALGGGLGSDYRVVGGWDFTENDADPYDDGPEGGHGSHVAGIVGADGDGAHSGVATGVDLVGLRVFDDAGNGYFSWVEQALRWVRDNRLAFENPITAINLSLGAESNSSSVPAWAMLEDEFADLEAAGVFISVSAGNSFADYNTPGLAYPASSPHVIPVMSVDNGGGLSYFSQRADNAIAAPGRWITSTVPDYVANDSDSIDDDWISMSGTSMAAPYVAGASVLVREAMEFVGQTDIDQWDIYNHMIATADEFFDSATDAWYKRLNLEAAIDALIPADDFGSSIADAYDLGTVNATPQASTQSIMSGAITTLTDDDYFTFTAGANGTVTATASGLTHELVVDWWGSGWTEQSPGVYTMDVVAGQSYTFAIGTSDGLGYYDLALELEATFTPVDLGAMADTQETRAGLTVAGEQWFAVTAHQAGYFTAQALANTGSATVAIYDAQQNLLAADSDGRADATVAAGESLLLRVSGASGDFDLRMTNAVAVDSGVATLLGTTGDDLLRFRAGAVAHTLSVNGVDYQVAASQAAVIQIDGAGGAGDRLDIIGGAESENLELGVGTATLDSSAFSLSAVRAETLVARGGGGDHAVLRGSNGHDLLRAYQDRVIFTGPGFKHEVYGFESTVSHAGNGSDSARLYDSDGADTYTVNPTQATMSGAGFANTAVGFDATYAYATGDNDVASVFDSAGNDLLRAYSDRVVLTGSSFSNWLSGFAETYTYASTGSDDARVYDSAGDDRYESYTDRAIMSGQGYSNWMGGFDRTFAYASGGADEAHMYDSSTQDDLYRAYTNRVIMSAGGAFNWAGGFEETYGYSTGGSDVARLYDSTGVDVYSAYHDHVTMSGAGFYSWAGGFSETAAYSRGGGDTALLFGSTGNDLLRGYDDRSILRGDGFFNWTSGFTTVQADGGGGTDSARLYDSTRDDVFAASGGNATMSHGPSGSRGVVEAIDFEDVQAHSVNGGDDAASLQAVDYALALLGSW